MLNSVKSAMFGCGLRLKTALTITLALVLFSLLSLTACAAEADSDAPAVFDNRVAATIQTPETSIIEGDITNYIRDLRERNLITDDVAWATVLRAASSNPSDFRTSVITQQIDKILVKAGVEQLGLVANEELVNNQIEDMKYDFVGYNGNNSWATTNNETTFTDAINYYGLDSEDALFADLSYKNVLEQLVNTLVDADNQFTTVPVDLSQKTTLTGLEDASAGASDTVVSPNDNGDLNKMDEAVRTAREAALATWLDGQKATAGIEIFDMPEDVPYNVDMALATNMPQTPTDPSENVDTNTGSNSSPEMIQAALDAGLVITDDYVGDGAEAVDGSKVSVWYTGTLASDGSQFDSNLTTGKPFEFTLGQGGVIKGWDAGVVGMKVGGKRTLRIPASLGYGANGSGEKIPPNADLVFTIELIDIL